VSKTVLQNRTFLSFFFLKEKERKKSTKRKKAKEL